MMLSEEFTNRSMPRLTGTIRAFSKVSRKYEELSENAEKNILKKRREREKAAAATTTTTTSTISNLSWPNLVDKLIPEKTNQKFAKLKSLLEKLKSNTAKQLLNEDFNDASLLNEAALFIFETFYDHRNRSAAASSHFESFDKISKKLKEKFGQFQRNLFDECRDLMENVFSEIDASNKIFVVEDFFKGAKVTEIGQSDDSNISNQEYFGQNIKFKSYYENGDLEEKYLKLYPTSDEEEEEDDNDLNRDDEMSSLKFDFPSTSATTTSTSSNQQQDDTMKHLEWTQRIPSDLIPLVYECLNNEKKGENELQNDLVELLGFDHLDTVEYLLANRKAVVSVYKLVYLQDSSAVKRRLAEAKFSEGGGGGKKPSVANEIVVHTEAEKRIKKQILKEEKRLKQLKISNDQAATLTDFDPSTLRKIREEQLSEARLLQLYHQKKLDSLTLDSVAKKAADQYPFVFDSLLHVAQTSAFVAGSKILLPENITRNDTRAYEEIFIPPSDSIAAEKNPERFRGRKEEICLRALVKCSEQLDPIGQIAFRNVKTLNRIQSVVFDTAYNTNQNLLICAPTGAGKTNIAMLTIVNQIRKHFNEAGVLRKDEFKIVYIAPMKALAAEMVENFSKRLEPLGIVVRELTGDMQLSKQEILATQILVTTPEKWDVVTRKSLGDISLSLLVKLLIIDEVHLLHDDRGSVIETIVARTLRQVESTQKMIRIVGLSATLPNYLDVARFLNVDPKRGLFFFDGRFRPVPLAQTFIGVKSQSKLIQQQQMDEVCYEKCLHQLRNHQQVMIFVHARNATLKTALRLRDMAKENGDIELFRVPEQSKAYGDAQKQMSRSRNKQLREIFDDGFAVHHAGLLRSDRNLVERLFSEGHIRVLVCTATLAWGVNLPAHAVIIKGTELYDAQKGSFIDISMLDVLQIFGRAGRPQFDTSGEAYIITTYSKLAHYLGLLTRQTPIESQFQQSLADNLNAEVCLGSVSNVQEAVKWLSYTYMFVRMKYNPLAYGLTYRTFETDPGLEQHREDLIRIAARLLDKTRMLRFDEASGALNPTDLGRTASHYYIKCNTIDLFNSKMKETMNDKDILSMTSECSEFQQLKVREEEMEELTRLADDCVTPVAIGVEDTMGKVNCLIQAFVSRLRVEGFSLVSDMSYVSQNVGRIARALFEISLKRGWALCSGRLLNICKSIERQIWHFQSPMRQFESQLKYDIIHKIEEKKLTMDKMRELSGKELGIMLYNQKMGDKIKECISYLPVLDIDTTIHPITRTVLRVKITLTPSFKWNDKVHGATSEPFWLWIEDPNHNHIYHFESVSLVKKSVKLNEPQTVVFTIPIFEPLPSQYIVRLLSDRWLGVEFSHAISFKHLILPEHHAPHTELLDLDPLPVTALKNARYEALYPFSHFNPIQTQIFHCLYHTDNNCLLGAPTGSGKTIAAEMAIFRVFNQSDRKKCVYIAPLKALVRERMIDWKVRLEEKLGKKVVELTGDVAPDMKMVSESDVIVTTPEKWDGISRSWQTRNYVKDVALIVIDEIHLLGEDRGPVLEVIVSRTNFISSHTHQPVRVIGLSTALANARDLANWLGIKQCGLYNFKPSVRPVPLEVHIQGFSGKFYCPRMATMNKPCFQEIQIHSPTKPVLIFVSSRRQTRLTALDLISFLARDMNPKQWLHMNEMEMAHLCQNQVSDQNLKLTLVFGIGLHHAGLNDKDRKLVEELYVNQKIQILIATSTLAWGVNFPAHLVIVKGTEFFDGKTKRYVDFPITDVLQMMGRAGRPQFDDSGIAVIMVHDVKKHFYKKFLYEPFPVESSLLAVLSDHLNAEIVASTITSAQEAIEYLTWTYFFRRLLVNPSYYGLESLDANQMNEFLSGLIRKCLRELDESRCVDIGETGDLTPTTSAHIASYYYLTHLTVKMFNESLNDAIDMESLIDIVSRAHEFDDFPVRHNEDKLNEELSQEVRYKVNSYTLDSAHTKVNLLLQAHFTRAQLPCSDYFTDTKSVLDQCFRIVQAVLDFCAEHGWLRAVLYCVHLMQMACQGRWLDENSLLTMPHVETEHLNRFYSNERGRRIDCLPALIDFYERQGDAGLNSLIGDLFDANQLRDLKQVISMLPQIDVKLSITGELPDSSGNKPKQAKQETKGEKEESQHQQKIKIDMSKESLVYNLFEDEEYVLGLDLARANRGNVKGAGRFKSQKAYTPKYSKPKDENWLVILGENTNVAEASSQLVGLKRVNNLSRQQTNVVFRTPKIEENYLKRNQYVLTVYFMSDAYLGLDQQFEINIKLINRNH